MVALSAGMSSTPFVGTAIWTYLTQPFTFTLTTLANAWIHEQAAPPG
jgi:hypothetical protein